MSFSQRLLTFAALAMLLALGPVRAHAQSGRVAPTPTPDQDQVTVYTEEVRVPVFARDEYERFDPTLEATDLVVLEDNVPQQVRSVRRIPASVVLVLGAGGELNPAQRMSSTRAAALGIVAALRPDDTVAILQFDRRVELLQAWTTDLAAAQHTLRSKLHAGSGARPAEALQQAAQLFAAQPMGNRHIVFISDGIDTPGTPLGRDILTQIISASDAVSVGGRAGFAETLKQLNAAQVTVHVISYTTLARGEIKKNNKSASQRPPVGSVAESGIPTVGIDPTMPPTMRRGTSTGPPVGGGVNFDPAMRRLRKAYEKATVTSEQRLKTLASETGGRIFLPQSVEEFTAEGAEVAREIGTQYVVTYSPKRPLLAGNPDEYRRLSVLPRRAGLQLRARRGYVAAVVQRTPAVKAADTR